jgi:PAS domain-containing protein
VGLAAMPHERDPEQRGREELAGELAAVRDRYRALFETLPFGVIRYSADGLILEANPAASQIMGVPPEGLLTWPLPSTLLLYTDGLIEDRRRDLGDGLARLADVMRRGAARTAEQTCVAVRAVMVGTKPRADDLCMLAARLDSPA